MHATMQGKELTAKELQSRGGKARAKKLSPEARSHIAYLAAKARWDKHEKKECGREDKSKIADEAILAMVLSKLGN